MSLILVSTPIGHLGDVTVRALEELRAADVIIGEDRRVASTLLKRLGVTSPSALPQAIELLNEHSTDADLTRLLELCRDRRAALITDCGTPGFADPGARLASLCRKEGIPVTAAPGASSLMAALTLSGLHLESFVFVGFLPQEQSQRRNLLRQLKSETRALVVMDTPYRLGRLLDELAQVWPSRQAVLVADATQPTESVERCKLAELAARWRDKKAEFILIVEAAPSGPTSRPRGPDSSPRRR
jgi:16S rRNA (cytidine1402-2'-O)-methyltransferase